MLAAVCVTLAFGARHAGSQDLAQFPPVPIDQFPASARAAVSQPYKEALARPTDPEAVGALGRVLHAWEQWESAHQSYSRARELAPKAFEWPYLDAIVLQRLARHDEAVTRLEQALAVSPDSLPARVRLAEARLDVGDLEKSQRGFEALVREPQAEPAARMGLGRIATAQGRHADAVTEFERAVALFPELGAAYYALARSYRALGRTADAERALELHAQFGARWPRIEDAVLRSVTGLRNDPRAVLQRGIALAESGDLEAAIAAHEAALAGDPSLAQAHVNLINLYGRARNWSKAEEHYGRAVSLAADLTDAHYDYGVILGLQEKWDPAADAYRQALALNPAHAPAHNNLGQILERRQEFNAASAEYLQALEAQPTFRLARFNLGRMLLVLGENDQAISELTKLSQPVDAETPRYMFALSAAYVRAGHKDDAIKWALEAKRLAMQYGQKDLAAIIDRDLAKLK